MIEEIIERFDDFIKKWTGSHYPHLIDSDENDGERFRQFIRKEFEEYSKPCPTCNGLTTIPTDKSDFDMCPDCNNPKEHSKLRELDEEAVYNIVKAQFIEINEGGWKCYTNPRRISKAICSHFGTPELDEGKIQAFLWNYIDGTPGNSLDNECFKLEWTYCKHIAKALINADIRKDN